MTDTKRWIGAIRQLPPPDLWDEVRFRVASAQGRATVPADPQSRRGAARQPWSASLGSGRKRLTAGAVAFAVFAAASVLLWNGFRTQGPSSTAPVGAGPPHGTFGDGSVSFEPTQGWDLLQGGALSACATTGSFAAEDVRQSSHLGPNDLLGCFSTAASLPPGGVLVTASVPDAYTWAVPNPNFPAGTIPPTLDPASCGARAFEGQPPGTTECHVWMTVNDRQLGIYVFLGTESPTPALMATAQAGLDALVLSEPASLGNDIAFRPNDGWYDEAATPTRGSPAIDLPAAWTSNVALTRYSQQYLPAGPSNADIARLPTDGVIVSVEQAAPAGEPPPDPASYQPSALPLDLSTARLIRGGWEGMADSDVSQLYLRAEVNGRPVIVQAFFQTTDPSRELIREASIGLARLVVVPAE